MKINLESSLNGEKEEIYFWIALFGEDLSKKALDEALLLMGFFREEIKKKSD